MESHRGNDIRTTYNHLWDYLLDLVFCLSRLSTGLGVLSFSQIVDIYSMLGTKSY